MFQLGNSSILLDDVRCTGGENRLVDCPRLSGDHNCDIREQAGVRCASKCLLYVRVMLISVYTLFIIGSLNTVFFVYLFVLNGQ